MKQESVGQPLFLMVSALYQQISKGPVDTVTEKALYTLNEDWLLWQAQGFNFSQMVRSLLFFCCISHFWNVSLECNRAQVFFFIITERFMQNFDMHTVKCSLRGISEIEK